MRPWSITAIWSARWSASSRYWVVSSIVVPLRDELADQVPDVEAAARVKAGRRLVEEHHGRRDDHRRGEVEAAAHAAGVGARRAVGGVGEAEALEQLGRARSRRRAREPVQAPDHLEVLAPGQQAVDGGVLPGEPDLPAQPLGVAHDVEPGDLGAPAVGLEQRREDPHRGRLAGAVGAEQAEDGAGLDLEVEAVERARLAEALDEALGADRGHVARGSGHRRDATRRVAGPAPLSGRRRRRRSGS